MDFRELFYIRGILRNKCNYFVDYEALKYLENAYDDGVPIDALRTMAYGVRNWTHFIELIVDLRKLWRNRE